MSMEKVPRLDLVGDSANLPSDERRRLYNTIGNLATEFRIMAIKLDETLEELQIMKPIFEESGIEETIMGADRMQELCSKLADAFGDICGTMKSETYGDIAKKLGDSEAQASAEEAKQETAESSA